MCREACGARTLAADLSFPVHVLARAHGVLMVLDGVHRLLKSDLLGHPTLQVMKLSMAHLDTIESTRTPDRSESWLAPC